MTTQQYQQFKFQGNIVAINYIDGNNFGVVVNEFDHLGNKTKRTDSLNKDQIQALIAERTADLASANLALADLEAVPVPPAPEPASTTVAAQSEHAA